MLLAALQKRLAKPQTSWQLSLLGLLGGVIAAMLIILFRLSIEFLQAQFLTKPDNYTSLDAFARFDLPIIGTIAILILASITGFKYTRLGIPFVLHRLKIAYGLIPFRNTVNQFFGSIIAITAGFSVGREGPAVHLGAAGSSFIGQLLNLPYNSIRTLCACGIAAGISASFNTPIAAVVFVMEVILREYKVHIFIPVMLASVAGSLLTQAVFGPVHEFAFFKTVSLDYSHYPLLIIFGISMGLLAFGFNRYLMLIIAKFSNMHIVARLMLAALVAGTLGYAVPYSMGTGLSAITFSLEHNSELILLLSLLAAKFLATIFALGLGIPGGIIGPILGIGAIAGTIAAIFAGYFVPSTNLGSDYALLGMAGMMAATLHAPLAALLAIIELSHQLDIVVPAMIVISSAYIASGQFFKNRSIFIMQLEHQQLAYHAGPIETVLQKVGVLHMMQENFTVLNEPSTDGIRQQLAINNNDKPVIVVKEIEGVKQYNLAQFDLSLHPEAESLIKTTKMPAISFQATLSEAYHALEDAREGAVYIYRHDVDNIIGVLTFEKVREVLRKGKV